MRRRGGSEERRSASATPPALQPISVRVPVAVQLTGISRSKLYELIKSGDLEIVKIGSVTLIPIENLQRIIDGKRS